HTHRCTHTHTHTQMYTHTHTHRCTHTHTHTHTHRYTHTHTHTQMYTRTHTHTHIHTLTVKSPLMYFYSCSIQLNVTLLPRKLVFPSETHSPVRSSLPPSFIYNHC